MSIRRRWSALFAALLAYSMPFAAGAQELDGDEDFARLAWRGFAEAVDGAHAEGSSDNSYAFSMAWFQGRLELGPDRGDRRAHGSGGRAGVMGDRPGARVRGVVAGDDVRIGDLVFTYDPDAADEETP